MTHTQALVKILDFQPAETEVQAVAGFGIDEGTATGFNQCDTNLTECSPLTIRLGKKTSYGDLLECYCVGCSLTSFDSLPPISGIEVLAENCIGVTQDRLTQQTWLVLVAPVVAEMMRQYHLVYHRGSGLTHVSKILFSLSYSSVNMLLRMWWWAYSAKPGRLVENNPVNNR